MRGEVVYLYAFDVANEIATHAIGDILGSKPVPFEVQAQRTLPRDVPLYKPLSVEPRADGWTLGGRQVRLTLRVYEVGAVSILVRAPFEADQLWSLAPLHEGLLDDGRSIDDAARKLCAEVCQSLRPFLVQPSAPHEPEAYTVFCLQQLDVDGDVNRWLAEHRRPVAALLTDTPGETLSESQIDEVLRVRRSYTTSDLVVIDWDAALAIELGGHVDDVLYVLELANLQLEEYRVMDQRLDRQLDRAYEDVTKRRFGVWGTYSKTLRSLRLFRVDLTKLNDEVTHISKFFGDWHLARVYLGAAERFYLNQWRASVEDRLEQLDQIYSVINADINNRRMVWLELIIVIFFAIDLALLVFLRA